MSNVVFLLMVITTNRSLVGSQEINISTAVYKEAKTCLREADIYKKKYLNKFDKVSVECVEREVRK